MVVCVGKGCKNSRRTQGVSLHRFPASNSSLYPHWIAASAAAESQKDPRLCSAHFLDEDFEILGSRRCLKSSAVPSRQTITHELTLYVTPSSSPKLIHIRVDQCLIKLKLHCDENEEETETGDVIFAEVSGSDGLFSPPQLSIVTELRERVGFLEVKNRKCRGEKMLLVGKSVELQEEKKELKLKSEKDLRVVKASNKAKISKIKENARQFQNHLKTKLENKRSAEVSKYQSALESIFTSKQIKVLINKQKQAKWTNEDIGRGLALRYNANSYERLREMGFPFPATRTLQTWTQKISLPPGILYPTLALLKQALENAPPIDRQCVFVFDEMALDPSVAYDANEDKVYGPKTQLNAYFVRGLFKKWKQIIAYEFDDDFSPEKVKHIIILLGKIGLVVRGMVNDLGGKNRGLMNKLGVKVRKSPATQLSSRSSEYEVDHHFQHPLFEEEKVYSFPDAVHLLKLLRNNLLKHDLKISGGHKITKQDFEQMINCDSSELKSDFKLSNSHLNLSDKQKQRVLLAVQLFSNTTAALWLRIFPQRLQESSFIQLVNDWFDVMNSRTPKEKNKKKQPFGMSLLEQLDILERMEAAVINLRVGDAKFLYPFQRGMLISINSMRDLFHEMSGSSMRISYILTHRLNQDIGENAFSVIRRTGIFNTSPSAVDAKHRLKLMMLSWGGNTLKSAPVQGEEDGQYLSAQMIGALLEPTELAAEPPTEVLISEDLPEIDNFAVENFAERQRNNTRQETCEYGGKEYLAGFIASKFPNILQLRATGSEKETLKDCGWVGLLEKESLVIPSIFWLNCCETLGFEFEEYHFRSTHGRRYGINPSTGVLKGFCRALIAKHSQIPEEPLRKYIKTRLAFRIRSINSQLKEERRLAAEKRRESWYQRLLGSNQEPNVSSLDVETTEWTEDELETESDEEEPEVVDGQDVGESLHIQPQHSHYEDEFESYFGEEFSFV